MDHFTAGKGASVGNPVALSNSVSAAPVSEVEQEIYTFENLTHELEQEIMSLATKLTPILAAGAENPQPSADVSVPRNSMIGRNLNDLNSRFERLIRGLRAIRVDTQL